MPKKTAKRICTLLVSVAAMLPFASTASATASCNCTTVNLGCTVPATCPCDKAVDYQVICTDGSGYHYVGPCCSCT